MCSDIGVLKEGKPPKKVGETIVPLFRSPLKKLGKLLFHCSGPPKKADKTLVSLCFGKNLDSPPKKSWGNYCSIVPVPPVKNIQTINNQSIRAGTMWNNVEQ